MLDLVVVDGRARGIVTRDLVTGEIESHVGRCGVPGHRRLRQRLLSLDQRQGLQRHGHLARLQDAALPSPIPASRRFTRPASRSTGDHQSKLTLMSESLRNDGRIWVPKKQGRQARRRTRFPKRSATTTSSASTRASATSCRATSPRAPPSAVCDEGRGVGPTGRGVYLDFADAIKRLGERRRSRERYGNLFDMYERITGENPYKVPMRIYPAVHYTMGGLWVDYNLMSTIPGLFVLGEANFSDHGANRLGASALMQGLADGYFVIPYTIGDYLARDQARQGRRPTTPSSRRPRGRSRAHRPAAARDIKGKRTVDSLPPRARQASCGRTAAWRATQKGLRAGARSRSRSCARSSGRTSRVPGSGDGAQPGAREGRPRGRLPRVRRADVPRRARSATNRCGGHFREEYQTPDGEAKRDDEKLRHVAAWEYQGEGKQPDPAQGAARLRERQAGARGATSKEHTTMNLTLNVWRQKNAKSARAGWCDYEANDVSDGHVVPRDARRRQRGADRRRARSRSPSTTTAAKASAARAAW